MEKTFLLYLSVHWRDLIEQIKNLSYTSNANMADHSVGTRDKYDSEASEASVFCFDNASSEKSCFVHEARLF